MKNRIKRFIKNFKTVIKRPEMSILPGQLAFFFVLSIVPTITLVSYGASVINISSDFFYKTVTSLFSTDIANYLIYNNFNITGFKLFLAFITIYYIASNGANSVIVTSNAIYDIKNKTWLERRIKAFIMTFILVILLIFMLLVPVFGDKIIIFISSIKMNENILNKIILFYRVLQGPIAWFIIFFFIKVLYTIAPDKNIKSYTVNYGAIFTTFGWIIITEIYSFYINNYAHYNWFYGSLSNIVILMLWFYFLAFIFTIGLALNYHKEENEK